MSGADLVGLVLAEYYYSGDEIKENEMSGTCSTYRGEMYGRLWWGNLEETDRQKTQPQMEDSTKMDPKETEWEGVGSIHLIRRWIVFGCCGHGTEL